MFMQRNFSKSKFICAKIGINIKKAVMGLSVPYHLIEFGLLLMLLSDDKDIGETV